MTLAMLRPYNDKLDITGHVSYSEDYGAWNVIRLKKDLLNEFPQLKQKTAKILYKLVFYKSHEELKEAIKQMKDNDEPIPILLYFCKEARE